MAERSALVDLLIAVSGYISQRHGGSAHATTIMKLLEEVVNEDKVLRVSVQDLRARVAALENPSTGDSNG